MPGVNSTGNSIEIQTPVARIKTKDWFYYMCENKFDGFPHF
jgi:hypothetical protein